MKYSYTFPTFPEARAFMSRQRGDCALRAHAGGFTVRFQPERRRHA